MINKDQVVSVARLSKLKIQENELEKYTEEISSIVGFFNILNDVDTKGVKPLINSVETEDVIFEDKSRKFDNQNQIIENFSESKERYLKTKPILS
ncbi:MAG: Asp-tRNA(Asn)/Glu-tRNA(Gln) amidotransferase subunit GatC [Candidatus Moranbacteria bacterium]|nr:Asp-tRNA(Asn)/Glu-tRNA(Gln) amidotransferase subunit GatC [Candidatus Moranbacteria bacterium]